MKAKVLVIGAGAFGIALGSILINNGHNVSYVSSNKNELLSGKCEKLFNQKEIGIPKNVYFTVEEAMESSFDYIILSVPSKNIKEVILKIKPKLNSHTVLINVAKGLEPESCTPWSIFIKKYVDNEVVSLLGPSFASDIIEKEKTIINILGNDRKIIKSVINMFNNDYFLLKYNKHEISAQYCSALKNSLAIIMGYLSSFSHSANYFAAFFTQGIKEVKKIISNITKESIDIETYYAFGDIYLTCTNAQSRNFRFGNIIYKDGIDSAIEFAQTTTVEGLKTFETLNKLDVFKSTIIFKNFYECYFEKRDFTNLISTIWKQIAK